MKRSKWCGEHSVPLRTISSNDVLPYFFEYDNSTTRISAGFLRIRLRIYAVCLRIRRVFLPYFLRIRLVLLRIRILFLLIRLVFLRIRPRITPVFLRIRRVFLPYFFGYDNSTTLIYTLYSSYGNSSTCIPLYSCCNSPVLLSFRKSYSSYFFRWILAYLRFSKFGCSLWFGKCFRSGFLTRCKHSKL